MNEFKIGDKIKVIDNSSSCYDEGTAGVVLGFNFLPSGARDVVVHSEAYGCSQQFAPQQLELVNE